MGSSVNYDFGDYYLTVLSFGMNLTELLIIALALFLPLNHLSELSGKLDPEQPVVTVCNSAYRSSMAVGILERKGFKMPRNLQGGSQAWIDAGLPVYESTKDNLSIPSAQKKEVKPRTKKPARPRVIDEGC